MIGVAFDFCGPAFVLLDHDAAAEPALDKAPGIEERLSRCEEFGLLDVGDDFSCGDFTQPVMPVRASDAPMT